MKTLAILLVMLAAPALAQEARDEGSIFDALKVGDWVSYRSSATGDLLDITIVSKTADTTIKAYREKLVKERADETAARIELSKAVAELRSANISSEERAAKLDELQKQRDRITPSRTASGLLTWPYEVSAIRKEYVVLSSGTQERFIARSAVRMVIRNLPENSKEPGEEAEE